MLNAILLLALALPPQVSNPPPASQPAAVQLSGVVTRTPPPVPEPLPDVWVLVTGKAPDGQTIMLLARTDKAGVWRAWVPAGSSGTLVPVGRLDFTADGDLAKPWAASQPATQPTTKPTGGIGGK